MTKNMKRMTALACAAMMIASIGITGCGKADGQTKEETKTTAVETPAGTETSATTENEAGKLPDGTGQESGAADTESASESDPMMGTIVSVEDGQLTMHRQDNGFDEDSVLCSFSGSNHDCYRCCKTKCTRTRDHKHCDRS